MLTPTLAGIGLDAPLQHPTFVDHHVTVFVYAARRQDADRWARGQGLRPRDVRLFGNQSKWYGSQYRSADRIVVLGEVDPKLEAALARNLAAAGPRPPRVDRLPAAEAQAGR